MTAAPRIETARLVLRPHRMEDFAPFAAFFASDAARYVGGPDARAARWHGFAGDVGAWELLGFGYWAIEERATGAFAGQVGLNHPPHFPEREIGWILMPGFEGRGYRHRGGARRPRLRLRHARLATAVSYIDPDNARSIALARRIGCIEDPDAAALRPERRGLPPPRPRGRGRDRRPAPRDRAPDASRPPDGATSSPSPPSSRPTRRATSAARSRRRAAGTASPATSAPGSCWASAPGGSRRRRPAPSSARSASTSPPHFPEREIGWILMPGFQRRGFATEAALAARAFAYGTARLDHRRQLHRPRQRPLDRARPPDRLHRGPGRRALDPGTSSSATPPRRRAHDPRPRHRAADAARRRVSRLRGGRRLPRLRPRPLRRRPALAPRRLADLRRARRALGAARLRHVGRRGDRHRRLCRQVGLYDPEGWIAPEIGWWIVAPEQEGKGFAFEAARAARRYAYQIAGWREAFSVIDPGQPPLDPPRRAPRRHARPRGRPPTTAAPRSSTATPPRRPAHDPRRRHPPRRRPAARPPRVDRPARRDPASSRWPSASSTPRRSACSRRSTACRPRTPPASRSRSPGSSGWPRRPTSTPSSHANS